MHATSAPNETDPYATIYDLPLDLLRGHSGDPKSPTTVEEFSKQYAQAIKDGDRNAISRLLTEDFVSLSPETGSVVGRQIAENDQCQQIEFVLEEASIHGDVATAWGRSIQQKTKGTFLWVLQRKNGTWKLARESR